MMALSEYLFLPKAVKSCKKFSFLPNLGTYETAKQAAVAYDRAMLKANQSTTFIKLS
jgi:hypothetical protein